MRKRVVGFVVARMGSTRIPGKSILPLQGKPLAWHIVQTMKKCQNLDALALATSDLPQDDPLVAIASECGIPSYRGSAEKVLDRLYGAALEAKADIIVDIGGDCPFLYPDLIDEAVEAFFLEACDYLSNYDPPTFPEGFDVNIVTFQALEAAFQRAIAPSQRVHPLSYLTHHKDEFTIRNFASKTDLSDHHWSLDYPEDAEFVRLVYEKLYSPERSFSIPAILELTETDPEVRAMNHKLIRPKAAHAFWNSTNIIRDMHHDISALTQLGSQAVADGDKPLAARCYADIETLASELKRQASHALENR